MVRSVVFSLPVLERIANVVDEKNYGAHYLDTVIDYPDHLEDAWNAFRHVDARNYGEYHLDFVIGHPEQLDDAFDEFQHQEPQTYRAHHLDPASGYPEPRPCIA